MYIEGRSCRRIKVNMKTGFDIGAYQGSFTDFLLKNGADKVFTFEPNTNLYRALTEKYKNNEKVKVYNCLVGDKNEKKKFYLAKQHHTISTACEDFVKKSRFSNKTDENNVPYAWNDPIEMDCYKLDTIFKNVGVPDFIKIDVEGFEYEVISGISKIEKPATLVFEIQEELIHKTKKCFEHLNNVGFKKFQFIEDDIFNGLPDSYIKYSELKTKIDDTFPTSTGEFFGTGIAKY